MGFSTTPQDPQVIDGEWVPFHGGELEGKRPRALCPACRVRLRDASSTSVAARLRSRPGDRTVCFQCYRAELERQRALRAAGQFDTASEARFQIALPFESVNQERLARLRAERVAVRVAERSGAGAHLQRGRQAQIAARHALQRVTAGLDKTQGNARLERLRQIASAIHAAELQLPDSWLPFVVSR